MAKNTGSGYRRGAVRQRERVYNVPFQESAKSYRPGQSHGHSTD
ncbi:hypothetical protein [Microcoleus sp. Z1_C3]